MASENSRPDWILEDGRPDRESVPLLMIVGNIQVLLENMLPCNGISLRRYDRGVVLVIHSDEDQKELHKELGFRTYSQKLDPGTVVEDNDE
jgi:hypothetical protein